MESSNYYLRRIAGNTGSEVEKVKSNVHYLKSIASNVGASVGTGLKSANHYLKMIEECTGDYGSRDDAIFLFRERIAQSGEAFDCKTLVVYDGKLTKDLKVDYYIGDDYLGYGYTNEYGLATLDYNEDDEEINGYVGTGKGVVEMTVESNFLQETFVVWDYLFYDINNSIQLTDYQYGMTSGMTASVDIEDNYKIYTATFPNNQSVFRGYISKAISGDFQAIMNIEVSTTASVGICNSNSYSYTKYIVGSATYPYYRITRINDEFTFEYSSDGVNWIDRPVSGTNANFNPLSDVYLYAGYGWGTTNTQTIKVKSIKVYSI